MWNSYLSATGNLCGWTKALFLEAGDKWKYKDEALSGRAGPIQAQPVAAASAAVCGSSAGCWAEGWYQT